MPINEILDCLFIVSHERPFEFNLCSSQFQAYYTPKKATPGIPTFSLPPGGGGSGFRLTFFALGVGVLIREIVYSFERKCRNFSICFKETGGSLKSKCSCAVLYEFLQKQ